MRNVRTLIFLSVILLGLVTYYLGWIRVSEKPSEKRVVNYTLTIQNKSGELLKNSTIHVFAPVTKTSIHTITDLTATKVFNATEDALENKILSFNLILPPYAVEVITVEAKVESRNLRSSVLNDKAAAAALSAEKYIESDDPAIRSLALQLQGKTHEQSAQNIFKWVHQNLKATGYIKDTRGARYAFINREGDCTEFAYLFVALARSIGIPARPLGGFIIGERGRLKAQDYHNWAEFYLNGHWRLADPLLDNFETHEKDYLPFRILSSQNETFLEESQRFMAFDQRLLVTMD